MGKSILSMVRRAKGMTQEEAAFATGISLRSLQSWESGKAIPVKKNLKRLLDVYDVDNDIKKEIICQIYGDNVPKTDLKIVIDCR